MSKKKKVRVTKAPRKLQQGGEQPEGGQMEEIMGQVQQMLEQGAAPEEVVAQLLQQGMEPQMVAQIFVQLGIPQEQVVPLIEGVMQQIQGAQQAPQEGEPQMQEGDEVDDKKLNFDKNLYEEAGITPEHPDFGKNITVRPPGTFLDPETGEYNTEPIITNRRRFKNFTNTIFGGEPEIRFSFQQGGEMEEVASQVQQMLEQGGDPQEVMGQLMQQGMQPEMIAQIFVGLGMPEEQVVPMLQDVAEQMQGGQEPVNPQGQQMMANGGQAERLMTGVWTPTKDDFKALKKKMLKKYEKGDEVKSFDNSDTSAYVQNLHGAIANHVSKNLRLGLIEKKFDDAIKQFEQLEKAQQGTEIDERQKLLDAYGYTEEDYKNLSDEEKREIDNTSLGSFDNVSNLSNENQASVIGSTSQGVGSDKMGKYFKGHGPGQRSLGGKYYDQRFEKTPLGGFFNSFSKRGTGNYNVQGTGELAGLPQEEIQARFQEMMNNPEGMRGQITTGYVNRRGKLKNRPGLFNRPEAVRFDYSRPVGERASLDPQDPNNYIETDEFGNRVVKSHSNTNSPSSFEHDYRPKNLGERLMNRRKSPMFKHGGSYMSSQPGKLAINFDKVSKKGPNSFIAFGQDGMESPQGSFMINEEQERTVDYGQAAQSIYDMGSWVNDKMGAIRDMTSTQEATENRQGMVPVYEPGSGAMGFYNQQGEARFGRSGQQGAGVRPGTGGGQAFGQTNYNYTDDLVSGQQTRLGTFKMGDEIDLSEEEIKELESYGYKLNRV